MMELEEIFRHAQNSRLWIEMQVLVDLYPALKKRFVQFASDLRPQGFDDPQVWGSVKLETDEKHPHYFDLVFCERRIRFVYEAVRQNSTLIGSVTCFYLPNERGWEEEVEPRLVGKFIFDADGVTDIPVQAPVKLHKASAQGIAGSFIVAAFDSRVDTLEAKRAQPTNDKTKSRLGSRRSRA
jgi:hypothetical protein